MTTHCSFGLFIFVSLISDQLQFIICLTYSESPFGLGAGVPELT
jgi:hypothetical protein